MFHIKPLPLYRENSELLKSELVLDIFLDCIDNGVKKITQNQILKCLGVSQKKLDTITDVVYDLKEFKKFSEPSGMYNQMMNPFLEVN